MALPRGAHSSITANGRLGGPASPRPPDTLQTGWLPFKFLLTGFLNNFVTACQLLFLQTKTSAENITGHSLNNTVGFWIHFLATPQLCGVLSDFPPALPLHGLSVADWSSNASFFHGSRTTTPTHHHTTSRPAVPAQLPRGRRWGPPSPRCRRPRATLAGLKVRRVTLGSNAQRAPAQTQE